MNLRYCVRSTIFYQLNYYAFALKVNRTPILILTVLCSAIELWGLNVFIYIGKYTEKRWFEHLGVIYTIFSKYLAFPVATFPLLRVVADSNCYLFLRQRNTLPIKLPTLFTASRIRIDTYRVENDESTINL